MSIPEQVGRYQVLGKLATGGMAEILLAKLTGPGGFQRAVVLKRVLPHLAEQSEFRDMFLDEARIVAGLRHPNVVQVQELGQEDEELYLVMEYLEGESLSNLMKRLAKDREPLPHAVAAWIAAEACAGLHAAHELTDDDGDPQHIIHRDVSPQNVLLTYDGQVKVLDFGIAKAAERSSQTTTGHLKGKFAYMAPEQCAREELDRRVDVFAMGVVLWELITHRRLFARDNELNVMRAIMDDPISPPSEHAPNCPPELDRVCLGALARDPNTRYATADALRKDLIRVSRALDPEGIPNETLAEIMGRVFSDRIAEKKELLRRVRAGQAPERLPRPEADRSDGTSSRRRPAPVPQGEPAANGTFASVERPAQATPTGSRRKRVGLALGLAALVAGGAAALWAFGRGSPTPTAAAGAGAVADDAVGGENDEPSADDEGAPQSARGQPASETDTDSGAAPAASTEGGADDANGADAQPPAQVSIRIDTQPDGARVAVDGEQRGTSPVTLELARSDDAVELTITRRGYRTLQQQVVPDVDQKLLLSLQRAPRRRPRGSGGTSSKTEGSDDAEGADDDEKRGFFRID